MIPKKLTTNHPFFIFLYRFSSTQSFVNEFFIEEKILKPQLTDCYSKKGLNKLQKVENDFEPPTRVFPAQENPFTN